MCEKVSIIKKIRKNIVNMIIQYTKNIYKSLENHFKNSLEKLSDGEIRKLIFKSIYNTLIYDKYIENEFENIVFEVCEHKFQGVIVNSEFLVFFSMALNNGKTRGRNTFLGQGFWPIYNFSLKKNLKIFVSLNPYSFWELNKNKEKFIINYRPSLNELNVRLNILEMKELGIIFSNTLNDYETEIFEFPISNLVLNTYLKIREKLRNKNTFNNGMYILFEEETNTINVFGIDDSKPSNKSDIFDGAKWGDLILSCLVLSKNKIKWNIEKLLFRIYRKINNTSITKKLEFIKNNGFFIEDTYIELSNLDFNDEKSTADYILKRNQNIFKWNIERYYKDRKECFACNYSISENLIASHIHRFSDIKEEIRIKKISQEEGKNQAVDGLNGFLLCPNHDKEFEKGIIYFDYNKMQFVVNKKYKFFSSISDETYKKALFEKVSSKIINKISKEIKQILMNNNTREKFIHYIIKHHNRISVNNNEINNL